ncbi:MAG: thymidylate synthase [marine bacterium B5-7]|nr:MAG: thymidylate synthase [marine bacterium B5-7]
MKQYLDTVSEVLSKGTRKENRTGVDTLSTFNINYEVNMDDGFPLLTTKEISWKNIVVENLWFLSGNTDIGLLKKHGCNFWNPWADDQGLVPSAYGNFWRKFPVHSDTGTVAFNDQVAWVLSQLRSNPMSRRMVISAWAPGNAQQSKLPPCHAFWVVNVQNDDSGQPRVCLHLTQRSCDVALGVPYNIAGYAFLLHLLAHMSGMRPGIFAHTLIDAHIYTAKADGSMAEYNHVPGLEEQLTRTPRALPRLTIDSAITDLNDLTDLLNADTSTLLDTFRLADYDPYPPITFKVAV